MSKDKKKEMAKKMKDQVKNHAKFPSNEAVKSDWKNDPDNESVGKGNKTNKLPAGGEKAR